MDSSRRFSAKVGSITGALLLVIGCSDLGHEPEPIRSVTIHPTQIDFGTVTLGNSRTDSLFIVSDGTGAVTVSVTLSSGDAAVFSLEASDASLGGGTGISIPAGDSVKVLVDYNPQSVSTDRDTIIVINIDMPAQVLEVPVSGQATEVAVPSLTVSPSALDFGLVVVGDSSEATLTLENSGSAPLVISEVKLAGEDADHFRLLTPLDGVELPPDDDTTLALRFHPASKGTKSARLTVVSNDPDSSSKTVNLVGTGSERITYDADAGPIIGPGGTAGCLGSCHGNNGWTYQAIVDVSSGTGMNYITPGDTLNSYLYLKIKGGPGISGSRMPRDNQTYFDNQPGELGTIRDWILQGAVEQ